MHLTLEKVTHQYPATGQVLDDVELTIDSGEFVSIVGPSGCGKSTLLRLVSGLEEPTAGTLLFDGREATSSAEIGFVFQSARLLPWQNAAANIALPLRLRGVPSAERREVAQRLLALVGLQDFAKAHPDQLSGGMQMRVSLARALATEPALMLLDEPFGALDEITRQNLNEVLSDLWRQQRWTAIFITHNVYEAVYLSQRVLVMSRKPGRIIADVRVTAPYPRRVEFRASSEFATLIGELLQHLQGGAL